MFHTVKGTGWVHGSVGRVLIQHAVVSEFIIQHEGESHHHWARNINNKNSFELRTKLSWQGAGLVSTRF